MADDIIPPGGTTVVVEWLVELAVPKPGRLIWTVLDRGLRLSLAQGWMIGRGYDRASDRDQQAAHLADAAGTHPSFPQMFDDVIAHMQGVYDHVDGRPCLVDVTDLVGVDLELVVVAPEEFVGAYPAGAQLAVHCFITRIVHDKWKIAAKARRLPVPGWPPTEQVVPGLMVD